jgi:hypothetical protein
MLFRGIADGDDRLPSSVRITRVLDSYRVTYEVRAAGGPKAPETVTTEVLEVERPFRSLDVTRAGRPPGGPILNGRVSQLNRLFLFDDGAWKELQLAPALAASDVRLDGVLDDLVAGGEVERRDEVRRVAGRPCQVYRFGGPISSGSVEPLDPDGTEHADACIDADGLVLSEVWVDGDTVLRRRTAVDVAANVDLADDTFSVEDAETIPAPDGGGSARRVTDDSRFGAHTWELAHPPAGFTLAGRWAVVWPRLQSSVDPFSTASAGRIAGMATVWTDGPDVLVVEQGGQADGGRPFDAHPRGERVDLGALDVGEAITDARGTEVRASYVDGSYVRVWGTLPRDQVIAIARRLRPGPGGTPVPVDR